MKQRKVPLRICVGCQQTKQKREMLRLVRTPEGELLIDSSGKKSGRGAYLCPSEECFRQAFKSKRIQRALEINVPEEVWQALRQQIAQNNPADGSEKSG